MGYSLQTVTRFCEGASFEDIESGDAFETAYIVYDGEGEIVIDTTDENVALRYLNAADPDYFWKDDDN